jgi:hypothetical protein
MVWRFLKWGGNLKPKSILVVVTLAWSICFRFIWCSGALERRELTVKRDQSTTETPVCAGLCTLKFAFWFVFGTCWLDIHLPCIYTLLMCEIQEERFCGSPATLCSSVTPLVESLLSDFNPTVNVDSVSILSLGWLEVPLLQNWHRPNLYSLCGLLFRTFLRQRSVSSSILAWCRACIDGGSCANGR